MDTFEMSLNAKGHAGMLSRIFGQRAGEDQKAFDTPIEAQDVYEEVAGS